MGDHDECSGQLVFKVLLPASEIPVNSTVTKRTGEHEYTLLDQIKVYAVDKQQQVINSVGVRYLVGDRGNINAIADTTVLCWHVEEEDLCQFLNDREATRFSQ
jgi:hypothetical protein